MQVKLQVQIPTEISLSKQQILSALEKLLFVEGYIVKDDELYHYERVGYSDYDYKEVCRTHPRYENLKKKVIAYNLISELLLNGRN